MLANLNKISSQRLNLHIAALAYKLRDLSAREASTDVKTTKDQEASRDA
jgi:hypothetical protein